MVRFGDVAREVKLVERNPLAHGLERFVGLEHMEPGSFQIREWGLIKDGITFTRKFTTGHLLFGKRRAYQRKVAVAEFDGICSSDVLVIEPRGEELLAGLLPFIVQSNGFFQHALGTSAGSLSPRTKWKHLASFELPLPPKDRQAEIVEVLWAADAYEMRLQEASSDLEELRRATIIHVYSRGLGHARLFKTPLGTLPASWEVAPLEKHYEVQPGKKLEPSERGVYPEVPCVRNANVQWNRLDLEDINMVPLSSADEERLRLKVGDILACEGRHVGKSALWRGEVAGACYQNTLHRLRALDADQVPEFMLHCLQFYSWAGRFRDSTGETTIPHLTAEKLRKMLFPFPPRDEQRRVADLIAGIGERAKIVADQITTARRLKGELVARLLNPPP
jgi:type I restriction enzyme S subunit